MKRLSFLLLLLFLVLTSFGQSTDSSQVKNGFDIDPSYVCEGCVVMVLDTAVGEVIDSAEKVAYHLFPYISTDNFQAAQFFKKQDGTIILVTSLKDGSTRTINYTSADLKNNIYLVQYYSGSIKQPEGVTGEDVGLLIGGLFREIMDAKSSR
jgi:hypothetical protein